MKTIKITHWNEVPTKYTGIVEYANGNKYWLLHDKRYTEERHKKEMAKRNSTLGKLLLNKTMFDLEEK